MLKNWRTYLALTAVISLSSCSKSSVQSTNASVSVKTELATVTTDSNAGSTRSFTSADIQYLESQVTLTTEQKAALNEVTQ